MEAHAGLLADPAARAAGDASLAGVRVAIVTYELVGLAGHGGIGTAYTALAEALATGGAQVEVLFTGFPGPDHAAAVARWRERRPDVRLDVLDAAGSRHVLAPYWDVRRAHAAHAWLRARHAERPYDVVHVPDSRGHGAYLAAGRRAGGLAGATLVVGLHSPLWWLRRANDAALEHPSELVTEHLERTAIEGADVVVSPSRYMLEEVRGRGVAVPPRAFVQQNVHPPVAARAATRPAVNELVFFGRLERRKGLEVFLDAVDALAAEDAGRPLEVTFLGRQHPIDGRPAGAVVAERAARWPWPWHVRDDLDQPQAVAHLRDRPCLTVIPSLSENSPMTVVEALSLGVPFLASNAGGIAELVDPADHAATIVEIEGGPVTASRRLAAALAAALAEPPAPARFAVDPEANRAAWLTWHAAQRGRALEPRGGIAAAPGVEVVATDEIARSLAAAGEEYVLLLDPRHALRPGAGDGLARAAAAAGADAVTFAVAGAAGDGTIVAPGGPAAAGLLHDVFSCGSALVRRRALDGVAAAPSLHAVLAALTLAGGRVLALPDVLADEREPGADEVLRRADAIDAPGALRARGADDPALAPYRAVLPAALADLPALPLGLLALAARERADRLRAEERIRELDGQVADAQAVVAARDAAVAALAAERDEARRARADAEREARTLVTRLERLRRRKAVRVALAAARLRPRRRRG